MAEGGKGVNNKWVSFFACNSVFTVGLAYTVNSDLDDEAYTEGDLYYYGQLDVPLAEGYSIGAVLGYYDFDADGEAGDLSYTHWGLSLNKDAGDFGSLSLNYTQTDMDEDNGNCFGVDPDEGITTDDACGEAKIWLGWSKTF